MSEKKAIEVTVLHQDIPGGGPCLSIDGHRVSWPKPLEQADVKYAFRILIEDLLLAVPSLASPAESDKEAVRNAALEDIASLIGGHTWGGASEHVSALIANHVRGMKSQPAQPSDTEMLDFLFKNNPLMPNGREAIKAAMRAEREGS